MKGQKKEDSSSTTTDEDEEEDENDNSKSGAMISSKKPRKDSGIHSMNSSSSTVASDKDIGVSRYVQNLSSNCCRDRDSSQNAQSFDIKRSNLQPLNVKVSAYKSTIHEGKFN